MGNLVTFCVGRGNPYTNLCVLASAISFEACQLISKVGTLVCENEGWGGGYGAKDGARDGAEVLTTTQHKVLYDANVIVIRFTKGQI
jgi:hypothetical protein